MNFDKEQVSLLIQNRRSVFPKNYSGERVSDEVIEEMLENANWAPTHKMTEPWRFVVFCDEGIQKFADIQVDIFERAGKKVDEELRKKLQEKPLMCSHIIAVGLNRDESIPVTEEIAAVAAAVQNMHLTATAHGVGCYWSTGGVTYLKEANKSFGLGPEDLLMGFLFVGMPKVGHWPTSKRRPIADKVTWVKL